MKLMRRRNPVLLMIIFLFVTGCATKIHTTPSTNPTQSISLVENSTLLNRTKTSARITSPIINQTPSLTPNYDPIIATYTNLPPEKCPIADPQLKISLNNDLDSYEADLLKFLSNGGTASSLLNTIKEKGPQHIGNNTDDVQTADLTGDAVPEIIVLLEKTLVEQDILFVFGCKNNEFITLYKNRVLHESIQLGMPSIIDLNLDGVMEIITSEYFGGSGSIMVLSILGWNGIGFTDRGSGDLPGDYPFLPEASLDNGIAIVSYGGYKLEDIDGNGTTEVVISSGWFRGQNCLLLYRDTKMVLMWNGKTYEGIYYRTPARYRIQAVWDGDHASLHGPYENALIDYNKAINDFTLLSWSPEYKKLILPLCNEIESTPLPSNPILDNDEWPRLAAYSYYRILLLNIVHGNTHQAQMTYSLLQSKYSIGNVGYEYSQMAKYFWDEYNLSKNILISCQKAIDFAERHTEDILDPLGSPTYGDNHWKYEPEEICPFQ
jgi:hypothetical protein